MEEVSGVTGDKLLSKIRKKKSERSRGQGRKRLVKISRKQELTEKTSKQSIQ